MPSRGSTLIVVAAMLCFDCVKPGPSPEQFLAERFARGEIDEDEYNRRLTVLRETTECGPRPSQR